jgi:HNH endonuclease
MNKIEVDSIEYFEINGCGRYYISKCGSVFSAKKNRLLRVRYRSPKSYPYVAIFVNGKLKNKLIHRLVALQFIPNPQSLPEVNHKDCNKKNPSVDNLEWISHKENIGHAVKNGRFNTDGWGNWNIGTKRDRICRRIMSDKKKGVNHPKFKGYYVTPFGRFESAYAAGNAEDASHTYIYKKMKSDKHKDYYFESK